MASFDIIKPKGIINPCNDVEVEGYGFAGVFLCFKFAKWQKTKKVFYCILT